LHDAAATWRRTRLIPHADLARVWWQYAKMCRAERASRKHEIWRANWHNVSTGVACRHWPVLWRLPWRMPNDWINVHRKLRSRVLDQYPNVSAAGHKGVEGHGCEQRRQGRSAWAKGRRAQEKGLTSQAKGRGAQERAGRGKGGVQANSVGVAICLAFPFPLGKNCVPARGLG
jgi:hypothetical protein